MAHRSEEGRRTSVAIVGTGMAGLVTAYLLNTSRDRYDVRVFESGESPSLDAASVNVTDANGRPWHIDVPMRAFTDGYYHNLKAMYDFLGVRYRRQALRYVFSKPGTASGAASSERPYFVHTSNRHRISCEEPGLAQWVAYLAELCVLVVCYTWFTVCCLFVQPTQATATGISESLGEYLQRIYIPQRFVALYLLPLFSAVATCSHRELLDFPASDIVNYRRAVLFRDHYVVSDGIQKVQAALTKGLNLQTRARVVEINPTNPGFRLKFQARKDSSEQHSEQVFDCVILAIPPNEVASIYRDVARDLAFFPTRPVTTVAHRQTPAQGSSRSSTLEMDEVHLYTTGDLGGWTQARHVHRCGVSITSNVLNDDALPSSVFSRATFTRVLRTPASKRVVDQMFEFHREPWQSEQKAVSWKNGDGNLWMAGAWCWDGMVLLEGAVLSAVRVAKGFDVEIPW